MPRANADLLAFNRGLVSPLALARTDVARTRLSAARMTNWMPKTQGAMRIRPGTKYLGSSDNDGAAAWIEFVASTTDSALIEITDQTLRVWADDQLLTRPAVSTTIANGDFASGTGWTDSSSGGTVLSTSVDAIPKMNAATTGGVTIAAVSEDTGDKLYGWKAADDSNGSRWETGAETTSGWWRVDFGAGNTRTIDGYTLRAPNSSGELSKMASAWTLEGSNDGSSWTVEDTRSGETGWSVSQKRTYTVSSPSAWRIYRLNISANNGASSDVAVAEVEMFEDATADQAQFTAGGLVLNALTTGGLAKVTREIAVSGGDVDVEHGLAIHVTRGPVTFRCGSTAETDDYISETRLGTGRHSLAFTPSGNFHLTFQSDLAIDRMVASVAIEAAGTMTLAAPWGAGDLDNLRTDQSADVVFVDCLGVSQRRIERRGSGRSWSLVDYAPDNGPFLPARSSSARLKPGKTFGNTSLSADQPFFTADHVGALFRLFHMGQSGVYHLGRDDVVSDVFEMTGIGQGSDTAERRLKIVTSGTWSATITVQRSYDGPDIGFHDTPTTITSNTTTNIDDDDDNLTVWYRLKIKSGNYGSGAATCTVTYNNGGRTGICRVTGYTSSTEVDVEVLRRFSSTDYSDNWQESAWSPMRGYPSSVAIFEGRLWHGGGAQIFGSVSDDYENFDDETEGDAGPILRTVGRGPVDVVYFLLPLLRLIMGTAGSEIALRSSSFDEPLTPENNSAKPVSTQGSANVRALAIDTVGVFVQRSGSRVFSLQFDFGAGDYQSKELTLLVPDLLGAGVTSLAIQRQPDTRIHFVLGDGRVAVLTYEAAEEVLCWSLVETGGAVEKAMVLPGVDEDQVYYHVRRTIAGNTRRYLEKWALEPECAGAALSWIADCAVSHTGAAATTIAGLDHLEGREVVVWADGADLTPDASGAQQFLTVSGGAITLPEAKTNVVVGLPFAADWQSTKLAYAAAAGTALAQMKRADHIAFILADVHNNGLFFGRDFDHLDPLPRLTAEGAEAAADRIFEDFDQASMPFPGLWDTDSRICLRAKAPRPVTVMAAVPTIQTNDKL